jgi:ABC-type branched-subunit amino acid transport system ATPase component
VAAAGRRVAPHIHEWGSNVVCSVQHEDRGGTEDRVEERTVSVSESGSPLLEVRGLVKDYPGVRALGGVDLSVTSGQVHCLIGQNGAGKSTLIKCVSGLVEPTAGEVLFEGAPLPVGDPNASIARGIATIYQELDLVRTCRSHSTSFSATNTNEVRSSIGRRCIAKPKRCSPSR